MLVLLVQLLLLYCYVYFFGILIVINCLQQILAQQAQLPAEDIPAVKAPAGQHDGPPQLQVKAQMAYEERKLQHELLAWK